MTKRAPPKVPGRRVQARKRKLEQADLEDTIEPFEVEEWMISSDKK